VWIADAVGIVLFSKRNTKMFIRDHVETGLQRLLAINCEARDWWENSILKCSTDDWYQSQNGWQEDRSAGELQAGQTHYSSADLAETPLLSAHGHNMFAEHVPDVIQLRKSTGIWEISDSFVVYADQMIMQDCSGYWTTNVSQDTLASVMSMCWPSVSTDAELHNDQLALPRLTDQGLTVLPDFGLEGSVLESTSTTSTQSKPLDLK
jgi:hypothetical protein